MYILLNDEAELQRFRFWYLNEHFRDVKNEHLRGYFTNVYPIPVIVDLLDSSLAIANHQGVAETGQTWDEYINCSDGILYQYWKHISLAEFLKDVAS